MRRYRVYIIGFIFITSSYLFTACSPPDFQYYANKRHAHAEKKTKDNIVISVFNTDTSIDYINGINLAVNEINNSTNKLLGKKIEIDLYNKKNQSYKNVRSKIINIAKNPKVIASLGNFPSVVAVPASIIYEKSHILFFPPLATSLELTRYQFQYVFRMSPNDKQMVEQTVSAIETLGYQNIVLLSSISKYHQELSYLFKRAIENKNKINKNNGNKKQINISYRHSFFSNNKNEIKNTIAKLNNIKHDAIFITSNQQTTKYLIENIRKIGINTPIILTDNINAKDFTKNDSQNYNDLTIKNLLRLSLYHNSSETAQNRQFTKKYQNKYNSKPNEMAALGYDTIQLLANSIRETQSTDSSVLATYLHNMPFWIGTTGIHSFTQSGDIIGKKYFFQTLLDKKWYLFDNLEKNYFLEKIKIILEAEIKNKEQISVDFNLKNIESTFQLAQLILKFKTIGIIHDKNDKNDQNYYKIIKKLSDKKNIKIEECHIPFSSISIENSKQQLIKCYAKLSPFIDALSTTNYKNIPKEMTEKLNEMLLNFGVPAFQIRNKNMSNGKQKITSTLIIEKTKNRLDDAYIRCQHNEHCNTLRQLSEAKLNRLLKGMIHKDSKINIFIDKSNETKIISLNLNSLIKMGYVVNDVLLSTVPDTLEK